MKKQGEHHDEYTVKQIADMLGTEEDMIRILSRRHRLKQVAHGHKIYRKHKNGEVVEDYVFYDFVLPVFRELLEACRLHSVRAEAKRDTSNKMVGQLQQERRDIQ